MDFLIVGYGSIGRRHAKNLITLGQNVSICTRSERNLRDSQEDGYDTYPDFEKAIKIDPDGVLICTPPSTHIDLARRSLEAGSNVFIEKPISDSLDGIDSLDELAREKGLITQVGYNLRFSPGLRKLKELIDSNRYGRPFHLRATIGQYLPFWRPNIDYRDCYTGKKELGGGLLMELSHEIDYVLWLLGKPKSVFCKTSKISDLDITSKDSADIIISFHSGTTANIHLDFLRKDYCRNCEVICQEGTLMWRFDPASDKNGLELRQDDPKDSKKVTSRLLLDSDFNTNDMYMKEIQMFMDSIETDTILGPDIDSSTLALRVVLAAYSSSETGSIIDI